MYFYSSTCYGPIQNPAHFKAVWRLQSRLDHFKAGWTIWNPQTNTDDFKAVQGLSCLLSDCFKTTCFDGTNKTALKVSVLDRVFKAVLAYGHAFDGTLAICCLKPSVWRHELDLFKMPFYRSLTAFLKLSLLIAVLSMTSLFVVTLLQWHPCSLSQFWNGTEVVYWSVTYILIHVYLRYWSNNSSLYL